MVARSDGANYGQLMVFQFPKQTVVYGPRQVVARINQDEVISPQITLWSQQGSTVIQGTLLVIPIEESLLYVQPLYLRAAGGRIPELKRVIVAYKDLKRDRIVMAETLALALAQVFSPDTPAGRTSRTEVGPEGQPPSTPSGSDPALPPLKPGATLAELAAQANTHHSRAQSALRAGNWALYGQEMEKLGQVLQAMLKTSGGTSQPPR
jgi:uncharacterized membrane protein (UPF0182 family)